MSANKDNIVTEPAARDFVISRTFDAPREIIFKAFTEAEHLVHWWGPKGFTMKTSSLDLRPSGTFHYCMSSAQGQTMWGKFVYREIVAPERVVFVSSFSDEDGNVTRAPFSDTWPLETLSTMTLTEQDGKTTLTMRGHPINASEAEEQAFFNGHASMQQGFGNTFNQLAAYLQTLS